MLQRQFNPSFSSQTRRNIVCLAWLLFLGVACLNSMVVAAEQPNILFIVADDLGWSDVGWHGGFAQTPHMDRLVQEGLELDRHYVQPVCTPTRAALMSGRYPGRFGKHTMAPSNLRAMPLETVTLASALKSCGYETAMSGKWHLGGRSEWGPNTYGFDHGYGTLTGAADPWTHLYRAGHPYVDTWHRDGKLFQEEGNATELIAAEAVKFIRENQKPWFVYVPFHAVHTPVDAPEEFKQLYQGVSFHDDPVLHESRLRMAAMVSQLDAKVGHFIQALEETGQRERTLVIFTSDNGGIESLKNAYVGNVGHSPLNSENDPLRGQKNTVYEGGIRVCAFANWPGQLQPRKVSAPMHVADWFPTLAHLIGYQSETDLKWDGVNQWPVLLGKAETDPERAIYIEKSNGDAAILQGEFKMVQLNKKKPELYQISADPYETKNLASEQPEKLQAMLDILNSERTLNFPGIPEELKEFPK